MPQIARVGAYRLPIEWSRGTSESVGTDPALSVATRGARDAHRGVRPKVGRVTTHSRSQVLLDLVVLVLLESVSTSKVACLVARDAAAGHRFD